MNGSRTTSQCRSCGRSVLWLRHEKTNSLAPIDYIASAEGNVAVDERKGTWRVVTTATERDELIGRLHKHHKATCVRPPEGRK